MKQSANHTSTILVVDLDQDDCQLFKDALAEVAPHTKVIFWEGEESLQELIQKVQPSMIFMEYKLAGESGVEWVLQIKSNPDTRSIPVVMWSTGYSESLKKEAYGAGVQSYMEKPWEMKLWVERVEMVVKQYLQPGPAFSQPSPAANATVLKKVDGSGHARHFSTLKVA